MKEYDEPTIAKIWGRDEEPTVYGGDVNIPLKKVELFVEEWWMMLLAALMIAIIYIRKFFLH